MHVNLLLQYVIVLFWNTIMVINKDVVSGVYYTVYDDPFYVVKMLAVGLDSLLQQKVVNVFMKFRQEQSDR